MITRMKTNRKIKKIEKEIDNLIQKEYIDKILDVKQTKSNRKTRNIKKLRRLNKLKGGGEREH